MRLGLRLGGLSAVLGLSMAIVGNAVAQSPIKVGELNSYKAIPAFLEPYRKGWELAVEEVNKAGGINGRPLEVV
jgi:branched-chain amino acid transport system substrate-binding protein